MSSALSGSQESQPERSGRLVPVLKPGFLFHGRYLIVRQLTASPRGSVHEAVDRRTRQRVAIKHIFTGEADALMPHFERITTTLLALEHPHLSRFTDAFYTSAGAFLVSELISGDTLWDLMEQRQFRPLPVAEVLELAEQALQALTALHTANSPALLHGDLKPHNLRLAGARGLVLVDVELLPTPLASLLQHATDIGATVFHPPETLQGQTLTPAADLYELGASLYFALTGTLPAGALQRALALALGEPDPLQPILSINPTVAPETATVIERALAFAPSERFQDAAQMWQALGDHVELPALHVASSGVADFATIGAALAAVEPGQRILIQPGRYTESLTLDKPVTLIGEGKAGDIRIESIDRPCITITSDQVNLHNLTIHARRLASNEPFFGVEVTHGTVLLEQCELTCESLACLSLHGSTTNALVRGCTIRDGAAAGIDIYDGAQGTIEQCVVQGNARAGIEISHGASPTIRQCKIQHGQASGVFVTDNGLGLIEECEVLSNGGAGIAISFGGNPMIRHVTIHRNQGAGLFVYKQGGGLIESCSIAYNQAAGIEIKEGGDPTIRRCELHSGQFAGVYAHAYALGRMTQCQIHANAEANVTIAEHSATVLRECQIYEGRGIGIWFTRRAEGTLEGCDIHSNAQANLVLHAGSNPIIKRCQIRAGKAAGVLAQDDVGGLLDDCQISQNDDSGVVLQARSNVTLMRCRIQQNQQYGVVVERGAAGVVRECILTMNKRGAWLRDGRSQLRSLDNSE